MCHDNQAAVANLVHAVLTMRFRALVTLLSSAMMEGQNLLRLLAQVRKAQNLLKCPVMKSYSVLC